MSSDSKDNKPDPTPPPGDSGAIILTGNLDYEVIPPAIGRGGYGEVYLARTREGSYCAVKVVYRVSFEDDRPYEREYAGILKFEPISRLSASQLQILRVGRRDDAGYFYYIMELADDVSSGRDIKPETYIPRTLKSEIQFQGGWIPARECCAIGVALAVALENLHKHRLVHRDIKPANIIFVHGSPKLADLGLVTDSDKTMTCVGTEGYIPPEGPGSARADIYALGMVLYEACTGYRHRDFPKLPENLEDLPDHDLLLKLNRVISKACEANLRRRYQSVQDLRRDLEKLLNAPEPQARVAGRVPSWLAIAATIVVISGLFWMIKGSRSAPAKVVKQTVVATAPISPATNDTLPSSPRGAPMPAMAPAENHPQPRAELQTLFTEAPPGLPPIKNIDYMVAGPNNSFYASAGQGQVIRLGLNGCVTAK